MGKMASDRLLHTPAHDPPHPEAAAGATFTLPRAASPLWPSTFSSTRHPQDAMVSGSGARAVSRQPAILGFRTLLRRRDAASRVRACACGGGADGGRGRREGAPGEERSKKERLGAIEIAETTAGPHPPPLTAAVTPSGDACPARARARGRCGEVLEACAFRYSVTAFPGDFVAGGGAPGGRGAAACADAATAATLCLLLCLLADADGVSCPPAVARRPRVGPVDGARGVWCAETLRARARLPSGVTAPVVAPSPPIGIH
jgi:hypothetical protein